MRKDCKDKSSFSILQIFFQERCIFPKFHCSTKDFKFLYIYSRSLQEPCFLKCGCKGSDIFWICKYFRIFFTQKCKKPQQKKPTYYIIGYLARCRSTANRCDYKLTIKHIGPHPPGCRLFKPVKPQINLALRNPCAIFASGQAQTRSNSVRCMSDSHAYQWTSRKSLCSSCCCSQPIRRSKYG